MPRRPAYCHLLPDAIAELEAGTAEFVGRRDLQQLMGVSKTVAWRILRRCGVPEGPGAALLCPRTELIDRLRHLQNDGGVHQMEIRRRAELGAYLERIRPDILSKRRRLVPPDQAIELLSTTFRKLPSNVVLTPTTLHVDFFGTEDFLKAVGSIVYAMHNDYEAISEFIEAPSRNDPSCKIDA